MNLLLPMPRREWLPPSRAEAKNCFGHAPIERRWIVKSVLSDGFVRWCGVFEDREDADAFLVAIALGTLDYQPDLWRLPTPWYCPDFGEGGLFLFAATVLFTSGTSSAIPSDWNGSANQINAVGGGGSAACTVQSSYRTSGGGGGEYRRADNFAAGSAGTPGFFSYVIGSGGSAPSVTYSGTNIGSDGNNGTATTFESTVIIANPGGKGLFGGTGTTMAGGAGGSGGTGAAANANGGAGAQSAGNDRASGGGGAGGPSGAGVAGTEPANQAAGNGGAGDASSGGTGGTGALTLVTNASITGGNGGNGSEWTSSGSGGGGGGHVNDGNGASVATGGSGGNYGGGGGGGGVRSPAAGDRAVGGAGIQGVIYITYTPLVTVGLLSTNFFQHMIVR